DAHGTRIPDPGQIAFRWLTGFRLGLIKRFPGEPRTVPLLRERKDQHDEVYGHVEILLRLRRVRDRYSIRSQDPAIGEGDTLDLTNRCAALHSLQRYRDLVSGL